MKNYIKIDTAKQQIIMDKTFYKNSRRYGTPEYKDLLSACKDFPGFTPTLRTIKKPDHNIDRNKGLNYEFMEDYINKYEPMPTREAVLASFHQMRIIAKAHQPGSSFATIKKWFLDKYPEVITITAEKTAAA